MPLTRYISPREGMEAYMPAVRAKAHNRFYGAFPSEVVIFLDDVLRFINSQPFGTAAIDGILRGTPAEPDGKHYRHLSLLDPGEWKADFHGALTVVPFDGGYRPCSPLIQIIRHKAQYVAEDEESGPVMDSLLLYYHPSSNDCRLGPDSSRYDLRDPSIWRGPKIPTSMESDVVIEAHQRLALLMPNAPEVELPYQFSPTPSVHGYYGGDSHVFDEFEAQPELGFVHSVRQRGTKFPVLINFQR
tara:strand:- start:420 stop:1151 length:732 start_codon:yes stop_codon:yes gene_type:complete